MQPYNLDRPPVIRISLSLRRYRQVLATALWAAYNSHCFAALELRAKYMIPNYVFKIPKIQCTWQHAALTHEGRAKCALYVKKRKFSLS